MLLAKRDPLEVVKMVATVMEAAIKATKTIQNQKIKLR
jgi:hypothetical protein